MTHLLLVVAASWLLLGALGVAAIAPLRREHRDLWLPAAPVLGAAFLVAVLSSTSWWLSVPGGLVVVAALAAVFVFMGVHRGRRPWAFSRQALLLSAATAAIGAVGAVVALIPNKWVGDASIVMPGSNHDGYFYVSESSWLTQHPITPVPDFGTVPGDGFAAPADFPMRSALSIPLRIGQPLVHAALGWVLRIDELHSTMPTIALWVALVAAAAFVAGRLLRVPVAFSLAFALVSSSSSVLLQQAFQQNMDSLLGVSLALLVVAACLAAVEARTPVWPASLVLVGLVGVYTEYAAYVAPMVLGGVLLLRRRGYRRPIVRAMKLFGIAVLISPTIWYRGVGALLVDRSGDSWASPFFSDGWYAAIGRVVGTTAVVGPQTGSRATFILAALIAVGCAFSVVFDRHRAAWAVLLVVGSSYVLYLTSEGRGYTQYRAVTLLLPLVLLAAVAGWSAAAAAASRFWPLTSPLVPGSLVRIGVVGAGFAVVAVWTVVNVRSAEHGLDRTAIERRHVTADFDEAAGWVEKFGGREGANVTALVPDLFTQLWTTFELRDDRLVSYVSLRPDYSGLTRYWAGESDRYLLVGVGAERDAAPETVVRSNHTFALLDTQAGPLTVASPIDQSQWSPHANADGVMTGPSTVRLTLLRSPAAPSRIGVTLGVPGAAHVVPIRLVVEATGREFLGEAGPGAKPVVVDLPPGQAATITASIDPNLASSLALIGVSNAP